MANTNYKIPYVQPHGDAYRYRRMVPQDVREAIGRKRWVKTWPARVPLAVIEPQADRLAKQHDALIARARTGEVFTPEVIAEAEEQARGILSLDKAERYEFLALMGGEDSLAPDVAATVNAVEHGGRYVPDRLSLTAAHERDKELYGGERDEKPIEYALDSFVATIGDKDVRSISRADASEWIAKQAKAGLSPATIKRRLGALRALVNRTYLDLDHAARNPFERHTIKDGGGKSDDCLPFNRAMLEKIDSYISNNRRLGHETKNIIRLMKGIGAGPAEIAGLAVADVSLDDDIPHVWIRANAIRSLKTSARDRYVPLVGDALKAARDACQRARIRSKGSNADSVPLFGSFGINGRGADSISAKVNKAIRAAGIPKSRRLVGYSFRHTMKEALRAGGVADHVQRRVLGHAGQGVADRYGSPNVRLAEARDALAAAMNHLGDVDPKIYNVRERI